MSDFRKALLPHLTSRFILYFFILLFVVGSTGYIGYIFMQISFVTIFLVVIYPFIMYIALKDKVRFTYFLYRSYRLEKYQKEKALAVIDSEIYDCKSLLNAEKSEMDVHRYNARDEADSMRHSKRGEREIRSNLGFLTRLQKLLVESMKKDPVNIYDIDLDQY